MLRSLRHKIRQKDITLSIAWRREAWKEEALDDLPRKDERGYRQSDEHWNCLKGNVRKRLKDRMERIWAFRAHIETPSRTERNRTELGINFTPFLSP